MKTLGMLLFALPMAAQSAPERAEWWVQRTLGPTSLLLVGPWATGMATAVNSPNEWGRTWTGAGRRYSNRLAGISISNGVEAALGAAWGEDPRYKTNFQGSFGQRLKRAFRQTFLSETSDGKARFAVARLAGIAGNNYLQMAWLPPSQASAGDAAVRTGVGYLGRFAGNLFLELGPALKGRWRRKPPPTAALR